MVTLENPTIDGGTLNTASGGLIQASGNPTLSGVTNKGTYQLPNDQDTTLVGTITNTGAIQLNSTGNATELQASGTATLTGGGTVTLSDNVNNYLLQASGGGSLTNVNNTISGAGNIGNGSMAFTNDAAGVVNAVSANGNALTITTGSAAATNLGLMEASSGGNLQLENTIANTNGTTNGTIKALTGGVVTPVSYTHLDVYKRQARCAPAVRCAGRPRQSREADRKLTAPAPPLRQAGLLPTDAVAR